MRVIKNDRNERSTAKGLEEMTMSKFKLIVIGCALLATFGCSNEMLPVRETPTVENEKQTETEVEPDNGKVAPDADYEQQQAVEYLESKGYDIITAKGSSGSYILERSTILEEPYSGIWAVQPVDPDHYFGKSITTYSYVVTNHPLEEIYSVAEHPDVYEIHVNVMLSEGEVIGGTSYPVPTDGSVMMGGFYSVDGQTLEEISGLLYTEWIDLWKNKYQ